MNELCGSVVATLDSVSAKAVHALWCEPDVRHHRDAGGGQCGDLLGNPFSAFEFHGVGAGFLHEPSGARERLSGAALIGTEG
ncbi:Uncharacterised protein [Mycobacteroides abscessus subsp. abscessus]|nr:Uncharacterised protein [Mycobacteroides abscessus subsp. abscessus]